MDDSNISSDILVNLDFLPAIALDKAKLQGGFSVLAL